MGGTLSRTSGATLWWTKQALTRFIYADIVNRGAGADLLIAGTDADTFVFNQLSGIDHVTDFATASDRRSLLKAMFIGLGAMGTLGSTAFYEAATSCRLATDRVIYDTNTGAFYDDADGLRGSAAVQIGILADHPTLANIDVLIL